MIIIDIVLALVYELLLLVSQRLSGLINGAGACQGLIPIYQEKHSHELTQKQK